MARQARQSQPQLVCILADDSSSMAGPKARAATKGIREMIMECQARGPAGLDRSYFKLLLIRFDEEAVIYRRCDMTPVRKIDPDKITLEGRGSMTNITGALELALKRLRPYMRRLQGLRDRADHPLPLVLLFSDGVHNVGEPPQAVADEIKSLALEGENVVIAAAGVSIGEDRLNDKMLREIASPDCYLPITKAEALSSFICSVGSSAASHTREVARIIKGLRE